MQNLVDVDVIPQTTLGLRPERLAWGVVLTSFAIFCAICIGVTIGSYAFLFQSSVPMSTQLVVGQGTAVITGTDLIPVAEQANRDITNTTAIVSTDSQSQTTISFREPANVGSGRLVAAVTLKRSTTLSLRRAQLPRFEWSNARYEMALEGFSGELEILVTDAPGSRFFLSIRTLQGVLIYITGSGRYTLIASETGVEVINQEGQVALVSPDFRVTRSIPNGERGVLRVGSTQVDLFPSYTDLLVNSNFESGTNDNIGMPLAWRCSNVQDDLPAGNWDFDVFDVLDGRRAMRFVRADNASSHGETRCFQGLPGSGEFGHDVSGYDYLALHVTMFIDYQSLANCGTDGSECPLMVRMDYLDVDGNDRVFLQGFYSGAIDTSYPTRCTTCGWQYLEHFRINEKAWYTYDSGNLLVLLPDDRIPGAILSVQFYTSGHQYDVYISEVSLRASTTNAAPG